MALLAAAGIAVAVTDPFSSPPSSNNGVSDNAYPISYANVQRETLQEQTEQSGTLTYASTNNSSTTANVILPAGTATSTIQQEEQAVANERQTLAADEQALRSTEASNAESLSQAEQTVSQDEASLALANDGQLPGPRIGCELGGLGPGQRRVHPNRQLSDDRQRRADTEPGRTGVEEH